MGVRKPYRGRGLHCKGTRGMGSRKRLGETLESPKIDRVQGAAYRRKRGSDRRKTPGVERTSYREKSEIRDRIARAYENKHENRRGKGTVKVFTHREAGLSNFRKKTRWRVERRKNVSKRDVRRDRLEKEKRQGNRLQFRSSAIIGGKNLKGC